MTIVTWGTGRPDFSTNVEYSTIPIVRSHQKRQVALTVFTYYSISYPYTIRIVTDASPVDVTVPPDEVSQSYISPYNLYWYNTIFETDDGNFHLTLAYCQYPSWEAAMDAATPVAPYCKGCVFGRGRVMLNWKTGMLFDITKPYADAFEVTIMADRSFPDHWPADIVTYKITTHGISEETT